MLKIGNFNSQFEPEWTFVENYLSMNWRKLFFRSIFHLPCCFLVGHHFVKSDDFVL